MRYLQCIDNPLVSSMIATKDIWNGHSQSMSHKQFYTETFVSCKGAIYANCSIMMFNE